MAAWDEYLDEISTYPAPTMESGLRTAGKVLAGVGAAKVAAAASPGLLLGLGFIPHVALAAGTAVAVRKLAGWAGGGAKEPPMSELAKGSVAEPAAWASLAKQERHLGAGDDYAAVTARLLSLSESVTLELAYEKEHAIVDRVVANAGSDRGFLEKVFEKEQGMTWSSLAAWVGGVEGALSAEDAVVSDWMASRIAHPGAWAALGTSARMKRFRELRNDLAHARKGVLHRAEHVAVTRSFLGCEVEKWWRGPAKPNLGAPVTALLAYRAELLATRDEGSARG